MKLTFVLLNRCCKLDKPMVEHRKNDMNKNMYRVTIGILYAEILSRLFVGIEVASSNNLNFIAVVLV